VLAWWFCRMIFPPIEDCHYRHLSTFNNSEKFRRVVQSIENYTLDINRKIPPFFLLSHVKNIMTTCLYSWLLKKAFKIKRSRLFFDTDTVDIIRFCNYYSLLEVTLIFLSPIQTHIPYYLLYLFYFIHVIMVLSVDFTFHTSHTAMFLLFHQGNKSEVQSKTLATQGTRHEL
jgi:hypothetical protein